MQNIQKETEERGTLLSRKMIPMVQGGSAIRAMFEEGIRMQKEVGAENVFDFSIGNPNVPAPQAVETAIRRLLDTVDPVTLHGYMPNAGFPAVRRAIADSLNRRYGTSFGERNLIMTVGAASGLNVILKTVLNPGEEVIVFTPYFMEYASYVRNYDGVLKEVPTDSESFLPDPALLRAALSEKTKAVIINSPNNPTGVIYGKEVFSAIAEELRLAEARYGTQILLISDEPYRELAYDGNEVPFVTGFYHNAVVCYSYSKSLSLPGERIGYLLIPDEVSEAETILNAAVIANRIIGSVNAPSLMQLVIGEVADTDISANIACYDRNRKFLYESLSGLGFSCVYPAGAFYLWVKAPIDEAEFVALCKKHYVLVVPGSSFRGSGYVRIAYCVSPEKLKASMRAFQEIAEELGLIR